LVEELRKAEADASLNGEIVYYTIKSEKPLVINVDGNEVSITKEELINKIKTENYRLKEGLPAEESKFKKEVIEDDTTNKTVTDNLNDELSRKQQESVKRIEPQETQEVINFYHYLYSAFSMETSVEVDEDGQIKLTKTG
jgi:hypothetical protein